MNSLYIKGTRIRCGNSNLLKSLYTTTAVCSTFHGIGSAFSINCLPTAVSSILSHSCIVILVGVGTPVAGFNVPTY